MQSDGSSDADGMTNQRSEGTGIPIDGSATPGEAGTSLPAIGTAEAQPAAARGKPAPVRLGLTARLALVITPVIALVLALFSYARFEREAELFDGDMRRDHTTLAHAVALGAHEAARMGADQAVRFIEEANLERADVEIRWMPETPATTAAGGAQAMRFRTQRPTAAADPGALLTTIPLRLSPEVGGHIQLEESLERRASYLHQSLLRTLAMAGVLVLVCAAIIYAAVWWLLGRRMTRIIDRIHAIGDGDLTGRLAIDTRDEVGVFARELDAMCAELAALQEHARLSAEARLATLEQLRHADRLNTVGKLASGIAHELGTPLNVVGARAKMIWQEADVSQEITEDARIIAEQVERMTRIIRQLLDFARVGKLRRAPATLGALVTSTLSMLGPLARKDAVVLEAVDHAGDLLADVDGSQIQQALANLIVNAIQAQPGGGRVVVTLERSRAAAPGAEQVPQEHVTMAVQDQGPGMSAEERERAFEPFYTTKDVGRGTGLGLSVSHGIIAEHGGWLELESEPGRGSCFTIHLPRVTADP